MYEIVRFRHQQTGEIARVCTLAISRSTTGTCVWCDEHKYEGDVPLTTESEATP